MAMKKILQKSMIVAFAFLLGCAQATPSEPVETQKLRSDMCFDCGFDTFLQLTGFPLEEEEFKEVFQESSDLFRHYNDLFDIYNDYEGINNIKTINDNAGIAPVTVEQPIIDLLKEAKEYYLLSDGNFDITMGNLLRIWHNYRTEGIELNQSQKPGHTPSSEELQEASLHKGWDQIIINEEEGTVFIQDKEISLDVGAIAKGFATELIARHLEEKGYHTGAINAGGNNRTLGQKPNGQPWRIGIQNPEAQGPLFTIEMDGTCSFVTSGDYERFYVSEDGNAYHHIIDPKTSFPATHYHSVSIVTQDSGMADCLSTTLFTLSYEEGLQLIDSFKQAHPDKILEVAWIMDKDKEIDTTHKKLVGEQLVVYTEGLEGKIIWQ